MGIAVRSVGFLAQGGGWGDCYGDNSYISTTGYLKRVTEGSTYSIDPGDYNAHKFLADQNESTRVDRTSGGSSFVPFNGIIMALFRRQKGTTGSWGSAINNWNPYTSQAISCTFSTYDYKWQMGV